MSCRLPGTRLSPLSIARFEVLIEIVGRQYMVENAVENRMILKPFLCREDNSLSSINMRNRVNNAADKDM